MSDVKCSHIDQRQDEGSQSEGGETKWCWVGKLAELGLGSSGGRLASTLDKNREKKFTGKDQAGIHLQRLLGGHQGRWSCSVPAGCLLRK